MRNLIITLILLAASSQTVFARPKDINFINHRTSSTNLDLGQTGPTMGDIHVNMGDVLDPKTNTKIGSYITRQVIVSTDVTTGTYIADMNQKFTLQGGTVLVSDIAVFSMETNRPMDKMSNVIVGGSGIYAGARGTDIVETVSNPSADKHIYLNFK